MISNSRVFLFITGFFTLLNVSFGQTGQIFSNKGDLDGAISFGPAFPIEAHRNGNPLPKVPTQFATSAYAFRAEANAGFGNGWKVGIGLSLYTAMADPEALSSFLERYIAKANYFMTKNVDPNPSYSSSVWFVQMENEIDVDRWRLAPHFQLGVGNFGALFRNDYHLKEMGTNYEMDVSVTSYPGAWPGFAYGGGMKAGFSPGGRSGKWLFFASADILRYRMVTVLEFRTSDILDNVSYNQQLYSATIGYYSIQFGGAYYLR